MKYSNKKLSNNDFICEQIKNIGQQTSDKSINLIKTNFRVQKKL